MFIKCNLLFCLLLLLTLPGCSSITEKVDKAQVNNHIPKISYVKAGKFKIIFVNNPEKILKEDLADADLGNVLIYEEILSPGYYCNFFEHQNCSGIEIGYAAELVNTGENVVEIKLFGAGYVPGAEGAKPFVEMYNNYNEKGVSYKINPGESLMLFKKNIVDAEDNIFCGAEEFQVIGGDVIIRDFAYHDFSKVNSNAEYEGYITYIDGKHRAGRLYKGIMSHNEVELSGAKWTIDDRTQAGVLPVQYYKYHETDNKYIKDSKLSIFTDGWISNITPAKSPDAIVTDMVNIDMRGWGIIDPLLKCDSTKDYPNIGNWGPIYIIKGTIKNDGAKERICSFELQAGNEWPSAIAYKNMKMDEWKDAVIKPNEASVLYEFKVPPKTSKQFECKWLLGGSSGGKIKNIVKVIK